MGRANTGFLTDERGAVTLDWVVLTALAAGFGLLMIASLGTGTQSVAVNIASVLTDVELATSAGVDLPDGAPP